MGKSTNLEDALENVVNKLDKIVEKTARDVGKKVKKDATQQAKKVVQHYYDSYQPKKYDRKFALRHAYKVWDKTNGNIVSVSIEFNPLLIKGEHTSASKYHQEGNSWKPIVWPWEQPEGNKYGVPEPDWILNNFWEGIHPRVYGNKYKGFEYRPVVDMKSPQELFEEFVNGSYIDKIVIPYASDMLTNRVVEALRKQF